MSETDRLTDRLQAVERALTGSDQTVSDLEDVATLNRQMKTLTTQLETIEQRLDRLDAAVQAVRGYVGQQKAVNDDVERRADAALAAIDRVERELDTTRQEPVSRQTSQHRPKPRQSLESFQSDASESTDGQTGLLSRLKKL